MYLNEYGLSGAVWLNCVFTLNVGDLVYDDIKVSNLVFADKFVPQY